MGNKYVVCTLIQQGIFWQNKKLAMLFVLLLAILKFSKKFNIQTGLNTTYMFMILPLPVIINKGHFLFNDTLNTFYLRLYGVRHMVKDHIDSERRNLLPPHGLLFLINS